MSRDAISYLAAALLLLLVPGLAGPNEANASATSPNVVPIDWSRFSPGKPGDPDSMRLESYVLGNCKYTLNFWYETVRNYDAQTGQYLTIAEPQDNRIRQEAGLAEGCATALATGIYDADVVGVPEEAARERITKVIASVARYHIGNRGNRGSGWGNTPDPDINAMGMFGKAGWLMWDYFTGTDRELVRRAVENEANFRLGKAVEYYRNKSGNIQRPGDSQAELAARQGEVFSLAVNMMPNHANRNSWENKGIELLLGSFARPADTGSATVYNGKALSEWLNGSNMESDGTITNHDRNPYPHYMADITANQTAVLTYSLAGKATPQAALFNLEYLYGAFVDKRFKDRTIYIPGSGELYFPVTNQKPYNEFMAYGYLDAVAWEYGGDDLASTKAGVWEPLHAGRAKELLDATEGMDDPDGREYLTSIIRSAAQGQPGWVGGDGEVATLGDGSVGGRVRPRGWVAIGSCA